MQDYNFYQGLLFP